MIDDAIHDISDTTLPMLVMLIIWVALVAATIGRTIKSGSVGLPAAFLLTMSFFYGGSFIYAIPGYSHIRSDGDAYLMHYDFSDWQMVPATGVSLLGVLGFAIGTGILSNPNKSHIGDLRIPDESDAHSKLVFLGWLAIFGYLGHYLKISFPLSMALFEAGRNIAVPLICLGAYHAQRGGRSIGPWVGLACLIPVYYFAVLGFLSYGFMYGTALLAFWMGQLRPRGKRRRLYSVLVACIFLYVLLMGFIGWFSFRTEFRRLIWQSVSGSIWDLVGRAVLETPLLTPWNYPALDMINVRLNLNIFVAKMLEWHSSHPDLKLNGQTLYIIPLALLPRFIWAGKPERGGSDFMQEHTGIALSETSSFGTGSVIEFYVNYGVLGVFFGFLLVGWCIARIDGAATRQLNAGNYFGFAQYYVIGVIAIDPLLRPFFIVNGALMAWIVMASLRFVFMRKK